MAKRFFGSDFAWGVRRCSTSARTVIAGTATAASDAASKPAGNSGSGQTNGTNRVGKGNSIIAIASGSTGAAAAKDQAA
jgi:hypothetical protein